MLIVSSFGFSKAQNTNFIQNNNETYQKYLAGDWEGLIKAGKEAHRNHLDYYYLNVRMGVAYFKLGKYQKAIKYFEKARRTNPNDDFVLDYLYYAYLYSGNEEYSLSVYRELPENLKANKHIPYSKLKDLDFYFSYNTNTDFSTLSSENYKTTSNSEVKVILDKNTFKIHTGLNFQLSKNIFLYQSFGYRRNKYLYIEQNSQNSYYNLSLNELRYYGKLNFLLGRRWIFSANYNLIAGSYQTINQTNYSYRGRQNNSSEIIPNIYLNFSAGFSISKQWNYFSLQPHIELFPYNGVNLYTGGKLTIYPFANSDFYISSDLYYNIFSYYNNPIFVNEIGLRIWKLYFIGTYYFGEMKNFIEDDGNFIYNINQSIMQQSALTVEYTNKNKTFYLSAIPALYSFSYKDEYLYSTFYKNYNNILLRFGIKIKLSK